MLLFSLTLSVLTVVFASALTTSKVIEQQFRMKRQNGLVDCVLPPYPENGQWEVINGTGKPGLTIYPNTVIKFSCNPGFNLVPTTEYFICDSDWNPEKMPRCEDTTCPRLSSSPTTIVRCFTGSGKGISCSLAFHGSTAIVNCAKYHELPKGREGSIQCLDRKWSDTLPECEPVCGKEVDTLDLGLSLTDKKRSIPKFPWIVSIFKKMESGIRLKCSGNLISSTHVLTAAHCVSDEEGNLEKIQDHQIAAGRAYRAYGDPRDLMAQYVQVDNIVIHPHYQGERGYYRADLALLKTKEKLRFSPLVQPVCFRGLNNIILPERAEGVVSLEANRNIMEDVKYFEIKRNEEECNNRLTKAIAYDYNIEDKICTLIEQINRTFCTGYCGSGLVFKNPSDDRYYLHGFASLTVRNLTTKCTAPEILYTNTKYYYDFLISNLDRSG